MVYLIGVAGVLIGMGWMEFLAWWYVRQEAKAECRLHGHEFGEPFGSEMGQHRNCGRCNYQQHLRSDGEWR